MNTFVRNLVLSALMMTSPLAMADFACDRAKVLQAIQEARTSPELKKYMKTVKPTPRPPAKEVLAILRNLELKVFGTKFINASDISYWTGATLQENNLTYSSMSDKSLVKDLENPNIGRAFTLAHELGHFVQAVSFKHHNTSPHGLENAYPRVEPEKFNILHSETDCIGIEILHQAKIPLTDDLAKTLSAVKKDCLSDAPEGFCNAADEVRQNITQKYIQMIQMEDGQ